MTSLKNESDDLNNKLQQVIDKSNAQKKILKKILTQLNTITGEYKRPEDMDHEKKK
jgi:hypothetical protein